MGIFRHAGVGYELGAAGSPGARGEDSGGGSIKSLFKTKDNFEVLSGGQFGDYETLKEVGEDTDDLLEYLGL